MNSLTVVLIVFGSLWGLAMVAMLVYLFIPVKDMGTNTTSIPLFTHDGYGRFEHGLVILVLIAGAPFFFADWGFKLRRHRKKLSKKRN